MKLIRKSYGLLLLGGLFIASPAHASTETVTVKIPKAVVVSAFNQFIQGTEIHVNNYGPKKGSGKNLSWLSQQSAIHLPTGDELSFDIPEQVTTLKKKSDGHVIRIWRHYINDLNSSQINMTQHGDRLRLTIDFESQGEEIKGKCSKAKGAKHKKWVGCIPTNMERDGELNNARLTIDLKPAAYQGGIAYEPLSASDVDFQADLSFNSIWCNAPISGQICGMVEDQVYSTLRQRVRQAVRQVLNQARGNVAGSVKSLIDEIQPNWQVTKVSSSGSDFAVTVQRPAMVGANTVSIKAFKVKQPKAAMNCPGKVPFTATVAATHPVKGSLWLEYLAPVPGTSGKLNWNMPKKGSSTSTVEQWWNQKASLPVKYVTGKTRLVVSWKGSDGKTYIRKSAPVTFQRSCTSGPGGWTSKAMGTPSNGSRKIEQIRLPASVLQRLPAE